MLAEGPAKKVTIFLNEDAKHHHAPLYSAILDFLLHNGVSGATVTRAWAGFGAHRVVHTPKFEALSEHLPLKLEFLETAERVAELLPSLSEMVTDGLIEMHDTTIVKIARKDRT